MIDCTPNAGTEPLTYEWFLNMESESNRLFINPSDPQHIYTVTTTGTYICAVSNDCGRATGSTLVIGEDVL